jgi:hypothetical protein
MFLPEPFSGTWLDLFPSAFTIVTIAGLIYQVMFILGHMIRRGDEEKADRATKTDTV